MVLAVPAPVQESAGNYITGALWNAQVYNGLTYLLNPPTAFLYQSVAQSIANATFTAITFDAENIDTYGGHSTTTNTSRYVAQAAGTYWVNAGVLYVLNGTGARYVAIGKNASFTGVNGMSGIAAAAPAVGYASVAGLIQLAAGDYIEAYTYQTSTAALSTSVTYQCSAMSVLWVHA